MSSLTKSTERHTRDLPLFYVYRPQFNFCMSDEAVQIKQPVGAVPGFENDGAFDERRDRHSAQIGTFDSFNKSASFRLTPQNCD